MKKQDTEKSLLIGAHTSAAGGVHKALLEGAAIGATAIQFFTSNQRTWLSKPIPEAEVERWNQFVATTGIQTTMSHDSYLINLGSPDPNLLAKSQDAFQEEIQRCHQLDITYLNFHPGSAIQSSEDECLAQIVASIESMTSLINQGKTRLLIEATAGQGTSVGHRFEHLGYLVDRLKKKINIGVCIDTCHIFAAGYDIRTPQGWEETLNRFNKEVGLEHLYALHVNDSLKPLGSHADRHADLGKGEIGIESFKAMMAHPDLSHVLKILETPGGPAVWKAEIQLLRDFAT